MKTNLTRKFSFLFLLLAGVTTFSNAQTFFEITAPASVIETYNPVGTANWGMALPDCSNIYTLDGEIMIIADDMASDTTGVFTDGCEMAGNDLTGMIALVDRGTCNFSTKALNAQGAGAIGVIICNNDPATTLPTPMGAGLGSDDVTIPVWGLEFDECAAFRTEIMNGTVTTGNLFYMTPPVGPDVILWGANVGEGDFSGGLNGWTTADLGCANGGATSLWNWDADADAVDGAFSAGGGVSQALTACNGAMVFDSDFYDNNGDGGNLGGGDCTAVQTGELISPAIDLNAITNGGMDVPAISVKWHQATRQFTSTYIVSYSNDGGDTWNDIEVNDDIETNSPHLNEERRALLADADLTSTEFHVKFRYEANYYYWIIDDVQLIPAENNNLQVNTNFYAIAPNALTPETQLEGFSFLADIANVGAADQPNTTLNISITDDGSGAVVYDQDLSYGTTVADSVYENVPFDAAAMVYTPVGTDGSTFTGTYSISSDSVDFDLSNNEVSFQFGISDTIFSKDFAPTFAVRPSDASWPGADEVHTWAFGNSYHIVNGSDAPNVEDQWYASSVTFAIEAVPAGDLVQATLYRWDNFDTDVDGDMGLTDRTAIAFAFYAATGSEDGTNLQTLQFSPSGAGNPNDEAGNIFLDSGGTYAVMIEYTASPGTDMEVSAADGWEYNAQTFRTTAAFGDVPYRPAALIATGDISTIDYVSGSFANIVPTVRLNIAPKIIISVEELDAANIISLAPNPADDFVNLNLDFVNTQDDIQVNILDVSGKTLMGNIYNNVSKETVHINTSAFSAGIYFINVVTEEGVRTERLIIQR